MSRVFTMATDEISYAVGIGGNLYIWSLNKESVIDVCVKIEKSPTTIYWNHKHECWAARVKSKRHKQLFYQLF